MPWCTMISVLILLNAERPIEVIPAYIQEARDRIAEGFKEIDLRIKETDVKPSTPQ